MPVTLIKKPAPKTKPMVAMPVAANEVEILEPEKLDLEELVDQYGRLQDETTAIMANPAFAQLGLIADELKKRLEEYQPDEIVQIVGKQYMLEAGACSLEQRKITDVLKVMTMLGPETFAKIAKVGVADAEKYLVPEQFESVVSVPGFTKNRKINVKYVGKGKPIHMVA
jgi:hypothetical protein